MSYDDDDDEITLNYNGERKKIEFDWVYETLIRKSKKKFNFDKNIELNFYYYDKDNEAKYIDSQISPTEFLEIYTNNDKNLMIYIQEKNKEDESNNISKDPNFSDYNDPDDSYHKSNDKQFIDDYNENVNKLDTQSKTEENKPASKKNNINKTGINPNIYQSTVFRKKSKDNDLEGKMKTLEEARNKRESFLKKKSDLETKNLQLVKKKSDIELLIQKVQTEDIEQNNDKILKEIKKEEKKLEDLDSEKKEEIEGLKEENSKLEKLISELSLQLSKQKQNQDLNDKNPLHSQEPMINNISMNLNITEISKSETGFFSRYDDLNDYFGNNENLNDRREKKLKKIKKINELIKLKKKNNQNTISELKKKNTIKEEIDYYSKLKKKKTFLIKSQPKDEQKEYKMNLIRKETSELKNDLKKMEEKISEAKKEIGDLKTKYDEEITSSEDDEDYF